MEMGRQTEALVQFHHCLKLQTDFAPAKGQIKKVSSPDMHFPNTPMEPSTSALNRKYEYKRMLLGLWVKHLYLLFKG